jgi:manganese/zinc/iron transport system substrate-binding protein
VNSCSSIPRRGLPALLFPAPALAQARLPAIITTTAMLADAVRALAGPAARVESLMGEGVDPHLFRPTRADTAKLLAADLVVLNGHRLEGRMEEVLARLAAAGRRVLAMAEALPRAQLRSHPEYPDAADPHVWMDPLLWAEAAGTLPEALAPLLPRAPLAEHLAAYRARLRRLHEYAVAALASIPSPQRVLVTAHDAFGYFARRYDLAIDSIQGLSTEAEASLIRIEAIVAMLVTRRVPAVFAETSVPDRAVRALIEGAAARGHVVRLGGNLFSDSMGRAATYTGTLEGMLDHNITTIARALGGTAPTAGLNGRL